MDKNFRTDKKSHIDKLIALIRKGDWRAQDFLYRNSFNYCKIICSKRNWIIPWEELEDIICFSVGKAIAKYEVCGRYWGFLSKIFAHDVHDYFRRIYEEKELRTRVNEEDIYKKKGDYDPTKRELVTQINKALSGKPKEQRKCIQLMLEGYSDEQIKNILSTKKSIKDLKYHAKMNLKKVLIKKFG